MKGEGAGTRHGCRWRAAGAEVGGWFCETKPSGLPRPEGESQIADFRPPIVDYRGKGLLPNKAILNAKDGRGLEHTEVLGAPGRVGMAGCFLRNEAIWRAGRRGLPDSANDCAQTYYRCDAVAKRCDEEWRALPNEAILDAKDGRGFEHAERVLGAPGRLGMTGCFLRNEAIGEHGTPLTPNPLLSSDEGRGSRNATRLSLAGGGCGGGRMVLRNEAIGEGLPRLEGESQIEDFKPPIGREDFTKRSHSNRRLTPGARGLAFAARRRRHIPRPAAAECSHVSTPRSFGQPSAATDISCSRFEI